MQEIARAFAEGGIFMYVILVVSVVATGLMVERFVFLFFRYNLNAPAFMAQIQKLVMGGNVDRAIKLCNAAPRAALAQVIKAGLLRANQSEARLAAALDVAILEVIPQVQRRTPHLQALANVATLMGLLGTIMGLVEAFGALHGVAPEQRAQLLALGISMAMNTTAFGLIVAIPCMITHIFLSATARKIADDVEQYSAKLEDMLALRREG